MKRLSILLAVIILISYSVVLANTESSITDTKKIEYTKGIGKIISVKDNIIVAEETHYDEDEKETKSEVHLEIRDYTRVFYTKGKSIELSDMKDKYVSYYLHSQTPITMIYPAKYPVEVLIVGELDDVGGIEFGRLNPTEEKSYLIDDRLIVGSVEGTKILDEVGKELKDVDLAGKIALVKYEITTRSLPPMTTPEEIIILDKFPVVLDSLMGLPVLVERADIVEKDSKEYIPLRKAFESNGYSVQWDENSHYITLTKDKTVVTIDSDNSVIKNGEEKIDMYIENGSTFIKL